MRFYLGTPGSIAQAQVVIDSKMPVLVSFAAASPWLFRNCMAAFTSGLLIDSGAYSELTGAAKVDIGAYREFVARYSSDADACAGLDDIGGDWRRSLSNYEKIPGTFPTFHDSDPDELLPELVSMARERGGWLGLGVVPPRNRKSGWIRRTLLRIPADIHVHGWALGAYRQHHRLNSVDSTNWFRDAMAILANPLLKHLTSVEALRIIVLRYQRMVCPEADKPSMPLWEIREESK